jgi:hypothetical protein
MNRKGFATFLVALCIFAVAIVLLSAGNTNYNNSTQKEVFSETNLFLTNYTVLLNRQAQSCDWIELATCVKTKSDAILDELLYQNILQCNSRPVFTITGTSPTGFLLSGTLSCSYEINVDGELIFSNEFSKEISVEKSGAP